MPLLLVLACTDYDVKGRTDLGPTPAGPDIAVRPAALSFDALAPDASATASFTVTNEGDADLALTSLAVEGTTAFTLLDPPEAQTLAAGAAVDVAVAFSPANPEDRGWVHVYSDDPDEPEVLVPLDGLGLYPELAISPTAYDFGSIPAGCTATTQVTLVNLGLATLSVESLAAVGADFAVEAVPLPLTIEPGASVALDAGYTPGAAAAEATLWVTSNDPAGLRSATWEGRPGGSQEGSDHFRQGEETWAAADILVYVDQSGSMNDDQANLAANFGALYDALAAAGIDWQLIVTNTDDGCNEGGILTPDSPDAETIFARAVRGGGGRLTEAGLSIAAAALANTGTRDCNEGFLRADARTTLLLVSDEPEQSPEPWDTYVAEILAMAPSATVVAVVGDLPDGCATAAPGTGYVEASVATGGRSFSICTTDWGANFDALTALAGSARRLAFELSQTPDPATLTVAVDGEPSDEWRYDAPTNAVVFYEDSAPPGGALIDANYRLAADCDQ